MDIHLTLRRKADGTIGGEAAYENICGAYDFALDRNFAVRRVTDLAGQACSFEKTHAMPDVYLDQTNTLVYRKAEIYRIGGDVSGGIKIEYAYNGEFTSDIAYNRISEEMIALDALYINFFPVPIALETTEKVRAYQKIEAGKENAIEFGELTFAIEGFEPYRVINSYSEDGRIFVRQFCKICPFKLLAVNEGKILKKEGGRATAYYFNEKESGKAVHIVEEASRMIEWYGENLFPEQETPERMYFFSYNAKKLGAFNRSITVELERFYSPDTLTGHQFLAHEIAHHWCMSEPPATWNEQMLAEGGAEWSCLLYSLSQGRARFMIDYVYLAGRYFVSGIYGLFHRKFYSPHLHGYRLFRGIYKKHGKDVLENCIRHFARTETKTMENFLHAVEANEAAGIYACVKNLAEKNFE